jgi:hypothetical protein
MKIQGAPTVRDLTEDTLQFEKHLWELTRGRFFSVHFFKANGELRRMVARLGVRPKVPKLTPVEADQRRANLRSKGMLLVWDATACEYRIVTVPNVKYLAVSGTVVIGERE